MMYGRCRNIQALSLAQLTLIVLLPQDLCPQMQPGVRNIKGVKIISRNQLRNPNAQFGRRVSLIFFLHHFALVRRAGLEPASPLLAVLYITLETNDAYLPVFPGRPRCRHRHCGCCLYLADKPLIYPCTRQVLFWVTVSFAVYWCHRPVWLPAGSGSLPRPVTYICAA